MQQDAWFYTREGEKIGPVTFSELKIKAAEGDLNPRLDMAWTPGMEAWKPAGEIEDLFEKRPAAEPQNLLGPPTDPYTPPKHGSVAETMGKQSGWPGARRRSYLLILFFFPSLWLKGFEILSPILKSQFGSQIMDFAAPGLLLMPAVVVIIFSLGRLANLGMSRWWFLGNFVPILGFWVGYRCFACPGGYAYHKKLDGAGIFLAIVYWLLLAIGLVAVALMIAVLLGALGSPEVKDQILEAIRQGANGSTPKP
jgi:hypothetical protein